MYFNSYIFVLAFLPIVLCGYYLINRTKKYWLGQLWLLLSSLIFIGYLNMWYAFFAIICILTGYLFVLQIRNNSGRASKGWLVCGLVFHIGMLLYFKYSSFFISNLNLLVKKEIPIPQIIIPLGISFFTFQQVAYLIECYKGSAIKVDLLEYALYIAFFPKFLQGPILLQEDMIPWLKDESNKQFSSEHFSRGLYAFALGLGKKVLLADNIALLVNAGYADIPQMNMPSAMLTILAYSLQLYYDFSGYCDMAIGLGEMFQIYMPINFNSPFKATSVTDIWSRWHMTLTRFFTKYVYIPLGGNRKGNIRMYVNTFIVFMISGLWHGAAWTFIVWGTMHAIAMVISKMIKRCKIVFPKIIGWSATFLFWILSFAIFRASTLEEAKGLFHQLLYGGAGRVDIRFADVLDKQMEVSVLKRLDVFGFMTNWPELLPIGLVLIPLICCVIMRNTQEKLQAFRFTYSKLAVTVILIFWSVMSFTGMNVFLYSNF